MKKSLKIIISMFLVLAMVVGGIRLLNYVLVDDTLSYTRLMFHEFYNQDDIDALLLGASHCYRGLDPSVLSEQTGKKFFSASTSVQEPDASLAVVKEAISLYDIKEVYLEVSASMAQFTVPFKERDELTKTYIVSDYLKPSINKYKFILQASSPEHYFNSFIPARRYSVTDISFGEIIDTVKKKSTDTYKNYEYGLAKSKNEWYVGNGFVANKICVDEHGYYLDKDLEAIDLNKICEDWKNSVISIVDYCNEHNVKIVLFDAPISNFLLTSQGNFDEYVSFIQELIKDKNAEFVEFNLVSNDYWKYEQSNYKDGDHLNVYGAEKFSQLFVDYLLGNLPKSAFCNSIPEKLNTAPQDFYGVGYTDDFEKNSRTVKLISNKPEGLEYKVEIIKNDGTATLLQDFETNNVIEFSRELITTEDGIMSNLAVTVRGLLADNEEIRLVYEE